MNFIEQPPFQHLLIGMQSAQVKGRAKALLDKHPLSKCSAEVQAAADAAQRARRAQGGRKRFSSRYSSGGSWGDANGRTPRPHSTPYHDGGEPGRHYPAVSDKDLLLN